MGLFDKPSAPTPPNPRTVSKAATGTAIGTAIANTNLGNVSQIGPYGSLTYDRTGSTRYKDPFTGEKYKIPTFSATTSLSPGEQAIFDQNQAARGNLASMAADASGAGLPSWGTMPQLSQFLETGSNDYSAERQRHEDALMARMQPGLSANRDALNTSLANQGIGYGAEAFNDAQFTQGQQENDARMAAILAGGEEQQRMLQMELAGKGFTNAARASSFGQGMDQFNAQNGQRSQALQQIMAMMGGSQPNVPNYTANRPSQIPTTDNAGIINNNYNQENANYQQELSSWNSMWGNLFGLGSAAVGVPR